MLLCVGKVLLRHRRDITSCTDLRNARLSVLDRPLLQMTFTILQHRPVIPVGAATTPAKQMNISSVVFFSSEYFECDDAVRVPPVTPRFHRFAAAAPR